MRKYIIALLYITLHIAPLAYGQGSRLDGVVQGPNGPIPNQFVAVCLQPANISTSPCSTLASLYTDITLSTVCDGTNGCSNPIQTDIYGNYHFYAATGKYTVQTYGPQIQTAFVQRDVILPCDPSNCVLDTVIFGTLIHNSSDVAQSGTIRLEHDDDVCWRNFANSADLCLTVDSSDAIQFPGGFGGGGGGTSVTVNGVSPGGTLDLNDITPVAGANELNLNWSLTPGSASVHVPITGNGTKVVSGTGSYTPGNCLQSDASGNAEDAGLACGAASSQVIQVKLFTGCTTGSGTYAECITSTQTWGTPFADANYALVCTPFGTTNSGGSKQSYILYWATKTAANFTVLEQNNRGSTPISAIAITCIGVHD